MTARDDAAYPAAMIFVGGLMFRCDDGPVEYTHFRLEAAPGRITLVYDDGIEHVATDPETIAFFLSGIVPSLRAAAAAR